MAEDKEQEGMGKYTGPSMVAHQGTKGALRMADKDMEAAEQGMKSVSVAE